MNKWRELEKWYEVNFPVKRILTDAQRKEQDAKAHVVTEYLMLEFKYVPGERGEHIYMFKNDIDAAKFDKYTNNVGRKENAKSIA